MSSQSNEEMEVEMKSLSPTPEVTEAAPIDMRKEENRLNSFTSAADELGPNFPPPAQLAADGFYLWQKQISGVLIPIISCVFCLIDITNWKKGESASDWHKHVQPDCPFKCDKYVGNKPLDLPDTLEDESDDCTEAVVMDSPPIFPEFSRLCDRLFSYYAMWPLNLPHKVESLASEGFFLKRPVEKTLNVICFQCGVKVPVDTRSIPKMHERISPLCPLVLCAQNMRTSRQIRESRDNDNNLFTLPDTASNGPSAAGTSATTNDHTQDEDRSLNLDAVTQNGHTSLITDAQGFSEEDWVHHPPGNFKSIRSSENLRAQVLSPDVPNLSRDGPMPRPMTCIQFLHYSFNLRWLPNLNHMVDSMTKAGFYYTGVGDIVQCYECGIQLHKWNFSDNPWTCHIIHAPECPHVREHCNLRQINEALEKNKFRSRDCMRFRFRPSNKRAHIAPL